MILLHQKDAIYVVRGGHLHREKKKKKFRIQRNEGTSECGYGKTE